ncbi:cytochrome P450 [Sorangium cellulosum]|uniref:Cytochrome P450 n=1 Tax=Sorangium cellulosum TaxID=56 RepID=A0A4P2Q4T4_SORCE|nr:cytochrome P450 [Sorangium cellulosum]AUX24385.1 cytochrome P450 [Sorangium cellulosum]
MHRTFNVFTPEVIENPYPQYAELRESAPICRIEPYDAWGVARYDDVVHVLKHPELFSSSGTFQARVRMQDERLQREPLILSEVNVISTDPPIHTQLRKLISGAFTPRAIARLEERVRAIATEHIDRILAKDTFDLMEDLAVPLPVTVIAEMLGVDPSLRADFKRWSDDAVNAGIGRLGDGEVERILRSRREMRAYFREALAERKRRPREDLIGDLLRGEGEYGALTEDDVLGMVVLLLIAGNETTTNLLGNGIATLLEHPDALRRLREDPALIPGFIEEVLRYDGPVRMLTRRATQDVTLAGVTIPKDSIVMPIIASANRDPAQFPDPDRFDITREQRGHVAFGHGIHFCVGAPLSRLEGRIAFEEIFRRLPPFSREPGSLMWNPSVSLRGLKSLPLRFDRSAPAA